MQDEFDQWLAVVGLHDQISKASRSPRNLWQTGCTPPCGEKPLRLRLRDSASEELRKRADELHHEREIARHERKLNQQRIAAELGLGRASSSKASSQVPSARASPQVSSSRPSPQSKTAISNAWQPADDTESHSSITNRGIGTEKWHQVTLVEKLDHLESGREKALRGETKEAQACAMLLAQNEALQEEQVVWQHKVAELEDTLSRKLRRQEDAQKQHVRPLLAEQRLAELEAELRAVQRQHAQDRLELEAQQDLISRQQEEMRQDRSRWSEELRAALGESGIALAEDASYQEPHSRALESSMDAEGFETSGMDWRKIACRLEEELEDETLAEQREQRSSEEWLEKYQVLEYEHSQLKHELVQEAKAHSPEFQQRIVAKLERERDALARENSFLEGQLLPRKLELDTTPSPQGSSQANETMKRVPLLEGFWTAASSHGEGRLGPAVPTIDPEYEEGYEFEDSPSDDSSEESSNEK